VLDDKGQPVPDPNNPGLYQTDGSLTRFIQMTNDMEWGALDKISGMLLNAAKGDDEKQYAEDLVAAVRFVNDFRSSGYAKPVPGTASGEEAPLPPAIKARLDAADPPDREVAARETQ